MSLSARKTLSDWSEGEKCRQGIKEWRKRVAIKVVVPLLYDSVTPSLSSSPFPFPSLTLRLLLPRVGIFQGYRKDTHTVFFVSFQAIVRLKVHSRKNGKCRAPEHPPNWAAAAVSLRVMKWVICGQWFEKILMKSGVMWWWCWWSCQAGSCHSPANVLYSFSPPLFLTSVAQTNFSLVVYHWSSWC